MGSRMTDAEIAESMRLIAAAGCLDLSAAFDRRLQIRDSGERGLGLVWEGDGECWAIVPDPFYTKEFLFRIKSMCNRTRIAKEKAAEAPCK